MYVVDNNLQIASITQLPADHANTTDRHSTRFGRRDCLDVIYANVLWNLSYNCFHQIIEQLLNNGLIEIQSNAQNKRTKLLTIYLCEEASSLRLVERKREKNAKSDWQQRNSHIKQQIWNTFHSDFFQCMWMFGFHCNFFKCLSWVYVQYVCEASSSNFLGYPGRFFVADIEMTTEIKTDNWNTMEFNHHKFPKEAAEPRELIS